MKINRLFPPLLLAAFMAWAPYGFAQDMAEIEVRRGVDEFEIRSVRVRTEDLVLPADAPILYRRLRLAVSRACYRNHSFIEYIYGPARREERRCRREALDTAIVALDDDSVTALHLQAQQPRALAAR